MAKNFDFRAALLRVGMERRQVHLIQHARMWKRRRDFIHSLIDGLYITLLFGYQLPHNSRWSLFAELFWTDCPVCLFWRGITFGAFCAGLIAALLFIIL